MAARVLSSIFALVSSPLVARAIGAEGRGLTATAVTVLALAPIVLSLGMPWAVRQRCAVEADWSAVMRAAQILSGFTMLPGLLVGVVVAVTVLGELDFVAKLWLVAGLALTPLLVSRNCALSVLVVHRDFRKLFIITLAQPFLNLVIVSFLYVVGLMTVELVIASYVVSLIGSYFMSVALIRVPIRGSRDSIAKLLRESLKSAGAQIAEIASYRVNQIILLPVIGAAALGQYAVAANVAYAPSPVGSAIAADRFTQIAKAGPTERNHYIRESIKSSMSIGVVAMAVVASTAPFLVPLLFGPEFQPAVPAVLILAAGGIFVISNQVQTSILVASARSKAASAGHYIGFCAGTLATVGLGWKYGLIGASIGSSASFLLTTVVFALYLRVSLRSWIPSPRGFLVGVKNIFGKRVAIAGAP